MKTIKYKVPGYTAVYHPETETEEKVTCFTEVVKPYTAENEETAKAEAYNGEYVIEDDGIDVLPTTAERLEALESAMLELIMEE